MSSFRAGRYVFSVNMFCHCDFCSVLWWLLKSSLSNSDLQSVLREYNFVLSRQTGQIFVLISSKHIHKFIFTIHDAWGFVAQWQGTSQGVGALCGFSAWEARTRVDVRWRAPN